VGYICLHNFVDLQNAEVGVMVFSNFCNSSPLSLPLVAQITRKKPTHFNATSFEIVQHLVLL
jgi:hypothetical protein